MDVIIRDAWFSPRTLVRVSHGADRLSFERCAFNGGEVQVDGDIDRTIFVSCLFLGTVFTGQPLTARIAAGCHWQPPNTEDAMPRPAV